MTVFKLTKDISIAGAERVLDRCNLLATLSSTEDAIYRTYLSYQHKECNNQVSSWMESAGMTSWIDAAGNCWGHYAAAEPNAPIVILGSHLDTVANAGKYDGILGVLSAIDVVDALNQKNIRLPFAIDVVGFGDEEGARFGATLIGSRAVCGKWDTSWLQLEDENGISIARALSNFGLSPNDVAEADRSQENILAYIEVHIEQGPVLERLNQPVGVVSAIAGARRFKVTLKGKAGHAGTVPMSTRQDALAAASAVIQEVERIATQDEVLATVGKITCLPGSINVIPGLCEFTLDVRSDEDHSRDSAIDKIMECLEAICGERDIQRQVEELHRAPAVKCTSWIQRITERAIQELNHQPVSLVSGAGHDAMAFDNTTDIGMLFVRCEGGISHHPAESVRIDDVNTALNVLYNTILKIADKVANE